MTHAPTSSGEAAARFDLPRPTASRRLQSYLHRNPTSVPVIVLLLSLLLFGVTVGPRFYHPFNLSLVLQQVTIIAIIGLAQTLVILTAGIDLAAGAVMVLSSVVMGRLAVNSGLPVPVAFSLGLLVGCACGAVNGLLVALVRLPPFIVTLGTWSIFGALNLAYSRSETIRQQDVAEIAPFLQLTGTAFKLSWPTGAVVTVGAILLVLLTMLIWYVLNRTAFGRHIYATGDAPDAARLSGIRTTWVLVAVYCLSGLICAVGGWVLIGRIGSVSPISGVTANIDSITAVVIGGTSLFGGRGSVVGTLVGALIVGVFRNGLALGGLDVVWQEFAVGVLIILAVTLDQWIRKASA